MNSFGPAGYNEIAAEAKERQARNPSQGAGAPRNLSQIRIESLFKMWESRRHRPRVGCEVLERRECPTSTGMNFVAGTLFISGTSRNDVVTVVDNGATGQVVATLNGASRTFNNVLGVVINTFNGNDTVNYAIDGALSGARGVVIDLGNGNDTSNLNASAGLGGSGALGYAVFGRNGADTIGAAIGAIAAGGNAGFTLDGGNDHDTIGAVASGVLAGRLGLVALGGSGNDNVQANMNLASGSTGSLGVSVQGGHGNDTLALLLSPGANALTNILVGIDGGPGRDTCTTNSTKVRVVNCEA